MVQVELDTIKEKATDEEKARLDFDTFDYGLWYLCVYGQMTGSCFSERAKELCPKNFYSLYSRSYKKGGLCTSLEKYLVRVANKDGSNSEKHRELIEYIKGERETIEL